MADDSDGEEKPFEATPRKLEEARKKGEVPLSQDLVTAGVFLGMLVVASLFGSDSILGFGSGLIAFLDQPDRLAQLAFANGSNLVGGMIASLGPSIAPWFLAPVIFALFSALVQNALIFAPSKLAPKLNRISPVNSAKQKFGRDGIFNFAKSFLKLCTYCLVLALVAAVWAPQILATPGYSFEGTVVLSVLIIAVFMATSLIVMLSIGGVDYIWQRAQHLRKHRMSLKELKDETKESEGDPHTKQARRLKAYDIATNQMISDVNTADVVIVNPQHYAVALKWSRAKGTAPICIAKGVDEVAHRIRSAANDYDIPIHRDPPTARALHASVEIGQEILPEHYREVAAAIRFADTIRAKARPGRWRK